jgi:hypothetical protein
MDALKEAEARENASCINSGIGESLGLRSALATEMRNARGTGFEGHP